MLSNPFRSAMYLSETETCYKSFIQEQNNYTLFLNNLDIKKG